MKRTLFALTAAGLIAGQASANLISEFEPNPAGGDPPQQTIELTGTPSAAFDLWILSIENDGFNGLVDRFTNVTGSYDANGFAVVQVPDFENPSNTVILTDSFTGDNTTDIDPANDGILDLSALGTIFDAVGISDSFSDDPEMYGALLGGTDILYNGQFEPLQVFRDGITGDWYQTVTVDFGQPSQRIGVFAANGGPEISPSAFTPAAAPTYGTTNPAIPEPTSLALLGLGGLLVARRRRG